ncbi:SDR family oxidoreductase [Paenibacillaceae bacterium]|nr:SDR family oxidoreductase [Paenibacillaceae bacterium]
MQSCDSGRSIIIRVTPGAAYTLEPITAEADIAESCFKGKFWPQYYAGKHAVPYLSQGGSIVLMSGAAGQSPIAGAASYAACNGAIENLGKALAIELAPIRANVVAPGTILTEKDRPEAYEAYKEMCLLGRVGSVEEIVHFVLYLMTNRYTTGSTLFPGGVMCCADLRLGMQTDMKVKVAMWISNADERRYLGKSTSINILRKLSHLICRKLHDFSRLWGE